MVVHILKTGGWVDRMNEKKNWTKIILNSVVMQTTHVRVYLSSTWVVLISMYLYLSTYIHEYRQIYNCIYIYSMCRLAMASKNMKTKMKLKKIKVTRNLCDVLKWYEATREWYKSTFFLFSLTMPMEMKAYTRNFATKWNEWGGWIPVQHRKRIHINIYISRYAWDHYTHIDVGRKQPLESEENPNQRREKEKTKTIREMKYNRIKKKSIEIDYKRFSFVLLYAIP